MELKAISVSVLCRSSKDSKILIELSVKKAEQIVHRHPNVTKNLLDDIEKALNFWKKGHVTSND